MPVATNPLSRRASTKTGQIRSAPPAASEAAMVELIERQICFRLADTLPAAFPVGSAWLDQHPEGDREFADSALEESGFEPLVPLLGGAAVKELFADYTAAHQSEDLAAALKAGAALLWCAAEIPTASW